MKVNVRKTNVMRVMESKENSQVLENLESKKIVRKNEALLGLAVSSTGFIMGKALTCADRRRTTLRLKPSKSKKKQTQIRDLKSTTLHLIPQSPSVYGKVDYLLFMKMAG